MKAHAFVASMVLALSVSSGVAQAGILVALQNQEVAVPVNAELGSILELPGAVKTVTPSKFFTITDLGGDAVANGAGRTDVRTFQVKPVKGARPESVTFVLAGGKSLALKLTPATGAEKFYEVHLEGKRASIAQKFLGSEIALMRAMLVDENGGYVREVVDQKVSASKFDGMDFTLARIYSAENLTGYVFRVRNKGKAATLVNPSALGLGKPNRAILAQADKERIEPCPFLRTKPECIVAIRLVVRGQKLLEPTLGALPNGTPPFVKAGALSEGGAQ